MTFPSGQNVGRLISIEWIFHAINRFNRIMFKVRFIIYFSLFVAHLLNAPIKVQLLFELITMEWAKLGYLVNSIANCCCNEFILLMIFYIIPL